MKSLLHFCLSKTRKKKYTSYNFVCELDEINEMNEENFKKIKSIIIIENIYLPFFENLVFISI